MFFFANLDTGNATEKLEVSTEVYQCCDFKYGICKKIVLNIFIFLFFKQRPYLKSACQYPFIDTSSSSVALPVPKVVKNDILASGLVCDRQN